MVPELKPNVLPLGSSETSAEPVQFFIIDNRFRKNVFLILGGQGASILGGQLIQIPKIGAQDLMLALSSVCAS